MSEKEIFLIDSNAFMTPYRLFYAFDLVPAYWREFEKSLNSGRVVVLDAVKDEIEKGKDDLAEWLSSVNNLVIIPKVTEQTIIEYQKVMNFVASSGYYKETALATWAPANIADPWLIASAKINGFTLVTEEAKSGGLSKKTPNRYAKLPDAAEHLGVKTIGVFDMMRKLGIVIK